MRADDGHAHMPRKARTDLGDFHDPGLVVVAMAGQYLVPDQQGHGVMHRAVS
ncbi:hypothetical protein D3C81_2340990 [compost metagenome]